LSVSAVRSFLSHSMQIYALKALLHPPCIPKKLACTLRCTTSWAHCQCNAWFDAVNGLIKPDFSLRGHGLGLRAPRGQTVALASGKIVKSLTAGQFALAYLSCQFLRRVIFTLAHFGSRNIFLHLGLEGHVLDPDLACFGLDCKSG